MRFSCIEATSPRKLDIRDFAQHNIGCGDASTLILSFNCTAQVERQSGSWDRIHRLCKPGNELTVCSIAVIVQSSTYTPVNGTKDPLQAAITSKQKFKPAKWVSSLDQRHICSLTRQADVSDISQSARKIMQQTHMRKLTHPSRIRT
jgi:hypothetical protein